MHDLHREDMARNAKLYFDQVGERQPWRFGIAGLVDYDSTFGYDVCTNQGPWKGALRPLRLGAIATLSLSRLGVSVEGFILLAQDRLTASPTEAQTRTPDGGFRDPTGLANVFADETLYGGRATYEDWATVVVGAIRTSPTTNVIGEDGRELLIGNLPPALPARLYVGAGIPRYDLFLHILFNSEDVQPDQLEIGANAIPLPWWELRGIASVGYIEDEKQGVLKLGVGNVFGVFTFDAAMEHRPVSLRHVRARADLGTTWGQTPTAKVANGNDAKPRFVIDAGTFAELSWFGSRYLEEQTGRDGVVGTAFGVYARPDITLMALQFDLHFGVNQPDRVAHFSESAGRWNVGIRLHGRFGL